MFFVLSLMTIVHSTVVFVTSMRPRQDSLLVRFMRALHESRRVAAERYVAGYRPLLASERELRELKSALAHDQRRPAVKHEASLEFQALRLVKR